MPRKLKTDTLTNSEDPDEMPHNAALHLGLHHLLKDKSNLQRKKYNNGWR